MSSSAYVPLGWENSPSQKTPINAINLNKMDSAIKYNRDAIINLENNYLPVSRLANNLVTTAANYGLDARQGKVLDDKIGALNSSLLADNAGCHNSIYRGKHLGSSVTDAQYTSISSGKFTDLFIGDYWTINGVNWRIAAFDYYWNCGDPSFNTHHAVIVPDTCLYNSVMNDKNITTGGYVGSKMYTEGLEQAKAAIKAAFSGHVKSHRIYLVNAVANGYSSGGMWADSEVDLMNERMLYGSSIFSPVSTGTTIPDNYCVEKHQLPLFQHDPTKLNIQRTYWERDVVSAAYFARVTNYGSSAYAGASGSYGVRPAFCIG